MELLYVEYPDNEDERGLLPVLDDELAPYLREEHAVALERAMELTAYECPAARFLAAVHRHEIIPRNMMHIADSALDELDPADDLFDKILDYEEEHGIESGTLYNPLTESQYAAAKAIVAYWFIAPNGLSVLRYDEVGRPTYTLSDVDHAFGPRFDSPGYKMAKELGLTHHGYQHKLTWTQQDDGEWKYELPTDKAYYSLGKLSVDGSFEPIVTYLGEDYFSKLNG